MKAKDTPYILAENCRILTADQIRRKKLSSDAPEVQKLLNEELFALDNGNTWYLINPVIKEFLEHFHQTSTLSKIIADFARRAHCKEAEVAPTMQKFFETMTNKKFLRPVRSEALKAKTNTRIFSDGTQVGRYQIVRRLFHNQKIEVYEAIDLKTREKVAVKALKISSEHSAKQLAEKRRNFLQEFELLKMIGYHPYICQMKVVVEQEYYCFGVLELVDDISIRRHLKNCNPPLIERFRLARQFFSAMAYVHQQGILHGDLHISNVLVHQGKKVKVIDFDMANRFHIIEGETIHYGGVHQYIAPEKINNKTFYIVNSRADYRSEVFQIGVIFYYMLYEKMPFQAFSWQSLSEQIKKQNLVFAPRAATQEAIPRALLKLLARTLAKKPEDRFASAKQLYQCSKNIRWSAPSIIKQSSKIDGV